MAAILQVRFRSSIGLFDPSFSARFPKFLPQFKPVSVSFNPISAPTLCCHRFVLRFGSTSAPKIRRNQYPVAVVMLLPDNPVVSDICATAVAGGIALSLLRLWQETAKRGLDQVLFLFSHSSAFYPFLLLDDCLVYLGKFLWATPQGVCEK